jgi:prevent-host-death family protein
MAMTVSTVKAREQFSDVVNRAAYGKERIILTRRGKKLVAVVPIEDIALLERLEDEKDIADARKATKQKGGVPWEVVKKRLKF